MTVKLFIIVLSSLSLFAVALTAVYAEGQPKSVFDFTMKNIEGEDVPLNTYKGKVILIVNVASKCGLTPQYEGLQKLYDTYGKRGLIILGFPANNFGNQEPGTDVEIKGFCTRNYGVT